MERRGPSKRVRRDPPSAVRRDPPSAVRRRDGARGSRDAETRGRPQPGGLEQERRGRPGSVLDDVRSKARAGAAERAVTAFQHAVDLLERGRDSQAVASAQEAKAYAPRSGAVREVLGLALYRSGRFREALQELQAYRRMTGRVDQNHLIADCYRAVGAPEKSVEPAREALEGKIPDEARAEAAIVAASALADLGRHTEALTLIRSFRTKPQAARPFDLRVWYVTGDILEAAGRRADAAEEFRRILRHDAGAFDAAERLAALSQ